jgi:hypothetical protein
VPRQPQLAAQQGRYVWLSLNTELPPRRPSSPLTREEGKLDEAKAHAQRALTLADGPRKLRVYDTLLSILRRQGDAVGTKATLTEALAYGRALPEAQRPKQTLERLEGELGKLP